MIICNICLYYVADPGIHKVGAQTLDEGVQETVKELVHGLHIG